MVYFDALPRCPGGMAALTTLRVPAGRRDGGVTAPFAAHRRGVVGDSARSSCLAELGAARDPPTAASSSEYVTAAAWLIGFSCCRTERRGRSVFIWPVVAQLLWVQLRSSFLLGPVVAAIFFASEWLSRPWRPLHHARLSPRLWHAGRHDGAGVSREPERVRSPSSTA